MKWRNEMAGNESGENGYRRNVIKSGGVMKKISWRK
jgi:hypothetical protein